MTTDSVYPVGWHDRRQARTICVSTAPPNDRRLFWHLFQVFHFVFPARLTSSLSLSFTPSQQLPQGDGSTLTASRPRNIFPTLVLPTHGPSSPRSSLPSPCRQLCYFFSSTCSKPFHSAMVSEPQRPLSAHVNLAKALLTLHTYSCTLCVSRSTQAVAWFPA